MQLSDIHAVVVMTGLELKSGVLLCPRPSKNAIDFKMRPRPLKTDLVYYNTAVTINTIYDR